MGFTLTLPMTDDLQLKLDDLPEDNIPHRWVLEPHGYGAHCPDCLELDGEVRTLAEWQNSIMPGSGCLQCGSGCRCSLQPTLTMPTTYNIFLPFGLNDALNRALVFRDGSRLWRYNFTEVLYGSRLSVIRPGRSPAASLPGEIAADRKPWWDKPARKPVVKQIQRPVRGVD
jgi:hypothetical protein